ncbi:Carbohydrate sulfotransferase 12 [Bagarius yarrelli]|uniref:Carbohydrate sulfotransferase n=1 Tax=Bagarius yarrelli TaxID=175774 RepID=A0A556VW17_BAGYA|nr:Carbohydrate sulfotransferase 12 [Bagarius yarrelli]
MELSTPDKMGKTRLFRIFLILGSVFMILLIIIYWDDVGATHFYLHTTISGPHSSRLPPDTNAASKHNAEEDKERSFLADIDAFVNQFLEGTADPTEQARAGTPPSETHNQSTEKTEERFLPRREWKIHLTPIAPEKKQRQENRKQLIHDLCGSNSSFDFPGKNRTFDDIPNKELDHLIVDGPTWDHLLLRSPKFACTNWKRIMIVLSESLLLNGAPYQDPLDIPVELIHNSSVHFTFNKFWKRYGKFSRHLMKIKLKKYTKFLFIRDPFVRLISAYRNKFELENEDFYKRFAVINYDFVGKLETLDEDAEHLLRLLRVDNVVEFPASHHNRTVSSWEQDWFANIPYESRKQLYKLYEADFQLFGYPKPEELLHK